MGSGIFFIEGDEDSSYFQNTAFVPTEEELEGVWEVSFDGSASKQGVGAWVWMKRPGVRDLNYSYKVGFDCMNNEAEYEAMILVILVLKELKVKRVVLHGDSELIF